MARGLALGALMTVVVGIWLVACTTDLALPGGSPGQFGDGSSGPLVADADPEFVSICLPLISGSGRSLQLPAGGSLVSAPGRAIVMQVLDDVVPGRAGQFDLVRLVTSNVAGGVVTLGLASSMTQAYSSQGVKRAQVCSMPQYSRVSLPADGLIAATPWNGSSGGVIAFFSSGEVFLGSGAAIDASAAGFQGGLCAAVFTAGTLQLSTGDASSSGEGGGKGEGHDPLSVGLYGRGAVADAGGGGDFDEAGGGGGANGGAGGQGGWGTDRIDPGNVMLSAGEGGSPFGAASLPRLPLLFGGGGAAGQRDVDGGLEEPCQGGWGGGVILIVASSLSGSGEIRAAGGVGADADDWGAGGGGGGGTILARVRWNALAGRLSVRGGAGGNVVAGGSSAHFGPGGGGGGGRIFVDGSALLDLAGGIHGTNEQDPDLPGWGAEDGQPGDRAPAGVP